MTIKVFISGNACAWECFWYICVLRKYVIWRKIHNIFSPYKENFFSKKHSNCDIFHLTVSSHTAKQSVQNCVLPCVNLHVITHYQSGHNALQQKHCRYMPHTRVMLIQSGDNGGVRGTRQFVTFFPNLTRIKQPFMHFDALCPSPDLLTKLQE
jgi:hypothetical protein